MGNTQQGSPQQSRAHIQKKTQRFILELRDRQIILDYKTRTKLKIGDIMNFPSGGYQGLHLWDSNVTLARYVLKHKDIFAGKSVVQLFSGTGIASIALKKFTKAGKIVATDHVLQVTKNIGTNCQKNSIREGMMIACMSWQNFKQFKNKFDFALGADIIEKCSSFQVIVGALNKLLNVGGKAIIIIPDRNGKDSSSEFVQNIDRQVFSLKKEKLTDQVYLESPLLNQVQGYEDFKVISQGSFYLLTLEKLSQASQDAEKKIGQENSREQKIQKQIKLKENQHKDGYNVDQQIETHEFDNKLELQVIKLKKIEDQPEYQKNRKRVLSQILQQNDTKNEVVTMPLNQNNIHNEILKYEHDLYNQPSSKRPPADKQTIEITRQTGKTRAQAACSNLTTGKNQGGHG